MYGRKCEQRKHHTGRHKALLYRALWCNCSSWGGYADSSFCSFERRIKGRDRNTNTRPQVAMTEVMRQLIAQQKEEVDKEDVRKKLNRLQNYVLGDAKAEAVMARPAEIAGRHEATPATTQVSKTGLGKVSDLISYKVKEKVEYLLCDMHDLELEEKEQKKPFGTFPSFKLSSFWTIISKNEKSDFYAQYGQIMVKHGYAEYAHDYYHERMAVLRLLQDIYDGSVRVKEIDGLDPLTHEENVDIELERERT